MAATSVEKQKQCLLNAISSATNIYDLIPLVKSIDFPLSELQQLLSHRVRSSKDNESIKKSYFDACSMNVVFASDLQQHILSFVTESYDTRSVCQNWNRLSLQNERKYLLDLCHTANQQSPIKHDKTNGTLVVVNAARRTALTRIERELGYKGPFYQIQAAVDESSAGDRLLICGSIESGPSTLTIWKDLQIVGVERNAAICYWQTTDFRIGGEWRLLHRSDIVRTHSVTAFCWNLKMKYPVNVLSDSVCCLNRCRLSKKISVHQNSVLRVTECKLSGSASSNDSSSCISVEPLARNVTIKNSEFDIRSNKGCEIWIDGDIRCDYRKMTKGQLDALTATVDCDCDWKESDVKLVEKL